MYGRCAKFRTSQVACRRVNLEPRAHKVVKIVSLCVYSASGIIAIIMEAS
jgi:hypothetical protein